MSDWQLVALGVIGGSALTFFVGLVALAAASLAAALALATLARDCEEREGR